MLYINAANGDSIQVMMSNNQFTVIYYNNDGGWSAYYSSSDVNLHSNTWFSLELALTPTSFNLYYNGASVATGTFYGATTGPFADALIGPCIWEAAPAFYVDDVAVNNMYIGP